MEGASGRLAEGTSVCQRIFQSDSVRGRRVIVGSSDTHVYGKFVVVSVLRALGAEVIDAGVDRNPEDLVALLAGQGDGAAVAISTHNGQCVKYAERLMNILGDGGLRP